MIGLHEFGSTTACLLSCCFLAASRTRRRQCIARALHIGTICLTFGPRLSHRCIHESKIFDGEGAVDATQIVAACRCVLAQHVLEEDVTHYRQAGDIGRPAATNADENALANGPQIDVPVRNVLDDATTTEWRLDVDAGGLVVDYHVFLRTEKPTLIIVILRGQKKQSVGAGRIRRRWAYP